MGYAIMRTAKLKGAGSIGGSIAHAYRERETPNADLDRTPDNEVLVQYDPETCRQDIEKGRTRSDNVEVIEVVLTTSPEWMEQATPEQKAEWKEKSMEWLKEEFGEENIQSAVLHKDETTDHISAHVTPIDENGKLNAKKWLGGKQKCQEIQDRYAEKVKDLGLERGERGSKARHQEVSKYYGRVEKAAAIEPEKENLRVPKVPESKGWTGLYDADEMKRHGENCGRAVRDQMRERERSLVSKVAELEADKAANRGNIEKNEKLTDLLAKQKPYVEFAREVSELNKLNPDIGKEITLGRSMKRQEWQRELKGMSLDDIDNRLKTEKNKGIRQDLVKQRSTMTDQFKQQQRELRKSKSHERGGMER